MASVGDILRERRIEQRRSIDQVVSETKIRINILQAIENNDLDVLPLPYVKSFVKTYARLLGLSDHEEIKSFLASQAQTPKVYRSTPAASDPTPVPKPVIVTRARQEETPISAQEPHPLSTLESQSRSNTPVNIIVSIGIALGALALIYYFVFDNNEASPIVGDEPPPTQPVEVQISEPVVVSDTLSGSPAEEAVSEQDSLILEAHATARVWISIVADGKRSSQMTLEADNTYRWSADSIFTLSLGNAGGVQFTLDGKPLKQMGKPGAIVRNIRITREGIVSSSSPYSSSVTTKSATRQQSTTASDRRKNSTPSITPAETKSPTPTISPADKRTPINDR